MSRFDYERQKFLDYQNTKEYKEKLIKRLQINESCNKNESSRVYAYALCKKDPIFFIENFGWTFDPRPEHEPHNLPFFLFEYQKQYITWLVNHVREGKDGLVEKSRDMGVSWLTDYVIYWLWLFDEGFNGLIGSRKEDLVDNRTRDSLFGMIDYAIHNTPAWLLPARFNFNKHRQHLKLTNPENYNLISGESMNEDFSRGARKKVIFFDEAAFWDYGREAWESAGDTTPCRIAISTPNGYNWFALLKESGIDTMTLHWKLHPFKDAAWYDYQKERRTEEEIAQEIDISYNRSLTGRVYPEWGDVKFGEYLYDPDLPLYVSWDFGQTDDTAMIWWQDDYRSGVLRIIDSYANRGKTIDFYIPFVTGQVPSDSYKYSRKDLQCIEYHKAWKKGTHFGDPAGKFTNQVTNKSVMDVLSSHGIYVNFKEDAIDFQTRKTASKLIMRNLVVNETERTKYLSTCMYNASYPQVRNSGVDAVKSVKPKHDWTSHFRSAFEYFAVNFKQHNNTKRARDKFPTRQLTRTKILGY